MALVTPLHAHYSADKLRRVVDDMRRMGRPRIRAYYDPAADAWLALEGTHRLRAAAVLGISPVMVPTAWPRSRKALERARFAAAHRGHVFPSVGIEIRS